MIRSLLTFAAVAFGASAVAAQSADPIKARQEIMKANSAAFRAVTPMLKGEAPYDKAVADRAASTWAGGFEKLPALFPANSQAGETRALPAIWTNQAGWNAAIANAKKVADAAKGATASLETFRTAAQQMGAACTACHKEFQKPQ